MVFEYSGCKSATTATAVPESTFVSATAVGAFDKPVYNILPVANVTVPPVAGSNAQAHTYPTSRCNITLTIPVDIQPPVMLYYKLTNFYQNHRRYTKSLDHKQLSGEASTLADIRARKGCPINSTELIYPCGFIANSMFNDSISSLSAVEGGTGVNYNFENTGIAWSSDSGRYAKCGYTDYSTILPPYNWRIRYPNGVYSNDFPPPDLTTDEHFQVWMRTAGWPTFLKPYGRNDKDVLKAGQYQMLIEMNFPIEVYGGKKYIVLTTLGSIGGRNSFLGIAYVFLSVLCAALGIVFTAFHVIKPRIIGDHSKISFGGDSQGGARSSARADDAASSRIRSRYEDD
ncbi:hypothetical protein BGX31_007050 [Mortierella sp. GBA43]|nr:hypothetical protein BGX31_007050 [Mortierella sp. GBA43]